MNLWRYFGVTLFLIAAIGFIGANNKSFVIAGGKDEKDKKDKVEAKTDDKKVTPKTDDKKVEAKTDDKKVTPKTEDKKVEVKTDDKKVEVKTDDKKPEVKPIPPMPAGEKVTFKAFEKDTTHLQLQETETTQVMTVNNQKVTQTQKQKFLIEWKSTASGKEYVVVQQVVGIQMDIDIGGNKIKYYSTDAKNPKNPMTDFFEQLMKNKLTFTITGDLEKVEKIEGRKEFIKALGDVNPQMNTLLDQILSEDALKRMAEPTWWAFPPKGEIPASKTWKKDSTLTLGPIGSYKTDFTFTHKETKDGKDTIDVKTNLTYTAPTQKTGLPFTITSADLKTEAGTGSATFDRTKGRFEKSELTMKLKGTLTIEVGNAKTEVGLEQTQTSKSTTLDAIPADWKSKQ